MDQKRLLLHVLYQPVESILAQGIAGHVRVDGAAGPQHNHGLLGARRRWRQHHCVDGEGGLFVAYYRPRTTSPAMGINRAHLIVGGRAVILIGPENRHDDERYGQSDSRWATAM